MRPLNNLISADEAFDTIMKNIKTISEEEEADIDLSDNRVLARDVASDKDVPPFNRSAVDGYAVRSRDTAGAETQSPVVLNIVGRTFAGENGDIDVREGECVEIATGAPVPDSCDAVVMVEDTEREGEHRVMIYRRAKQFENVSIAGEDIKRGSIVLEKGTLMDPSKIGALAALGVQYVSVLKKPRVALISTGNEVIPLGEKLEGGQIYDINTHTLKSLIERNFCDPVLYGIVRDRREDLKEAIDAATENDMIVLSGGSSVGERDMLVDILGSSVLFHGIRIKPGKPTLFAMHKNKPVLGLPGFPTSCLMNGYLFLAPAMRKLAGAPARERRIMRARMGHEMRFAPGRDKHITVILKEGYAYSVYKESSTITSLAKAIGFITVDGSKTLVEKGEDVEVELFSW